MTLLMINIIGSKNEYIIRHCIANRINVFSADRLETVHEVLSNHNVTHILIDLSSKIINWFDFIKQLKQSEAGSNYKVIVLSNRQDKDFVKKLLMLGIVGFISSNYDEELTFKKVDKIMKITANINNDRKHFRVSIPRDKSIKINFRLPNQDKFINGSVTDLSIVALAFRLDVPDDAKDIETGINIDKVQLKIDNKLILIPMVILKTGPISVGRIVEPSDNAANHISQYIYKAMLKGAGIGKADSQKAKSH